jgi:heme-degrading monooxygenase HmoA
MRSYKQAMQAEGNQKLLTKIAGGYALTITAWKDEESMKKFKNSGAHKDAMKAMARISDRYRSVHGLMDEVPSWPLAYQKLEEKEFINI